MCSTPFTLSSVSSDAACNGCSSLVIVGIHWALCRRPVQTWQMVKALNQCPVSHGLPRRAGPPSLKPNQTSACAPPRRVYMGLPMSSVWAFWFYVFFHIV